MSSIFNNFEEYMRSSVITQCIEHRHKSEVTFTRERKFELEVTGPGF